MPSTSDSPPSAAYYTALLRAQRRVVGIGKHARNTQQGYDFTSSEELIAICSAALNEEGLVVRRVKSSLAAWGEHTLHTRNGESRMMCATASIVFRVTHAESGFSEDVPMEFPAVAQGGRPADKAVAAAFTASLGYFLRDLLAVARGHDQYDIDKRGEPAPSAGAPPQHQPGGKPRASFGELCAMLGQHSMTIDDLNAWRLQVYDKAPVTSSDNDFHIGAVLARLNDPAADDNGAALGAWTRGQK